jgi:hypothetical protein
LGVCREILVERREFRARHETVPLTNDIAGEEVASRLPLPTARSAAPRFARDSSLFYLASRSGADALWRLSGTTASEVWRPVDGAVVSAAAAPDGKKMCFVVRRERRSTLQCGRADGKDVAPLAEALAPVDDADESPAAEADEAPAADTAEAAAEGEQPEG